MDNNDFEALSVWITKAGLAGERETPILAGFCEREVARGVPLARALVLKGRLVSVGRYALRGVARPQDLFTLE